MADLFELDSIQKSLEMQRLQFTEIAALMKVNALLRPLFCQMHKNAHEPPYSYSEAYKVFVEKQASVKDCEDKAKNLTKELECAEFEKNVLNSLGWALNSTTMEQFSMIREVLLTTEQEKQDFDKQSVENYKKEAADNKNLAVYKQFAAQLKLQFLQEPINGKNAVAANPTVFEVPKQGSEIDEFLLREFAYIDEDDEDDGKGQGDTAVLVRRTDSAKTLDVDKVGEADDLFQQSRRNWTWKKRILVIIGISLVVMCVIAGIAKVVLG